MSDASEKPRADVGEDETRPAAASVTNGLKLLEPLADVSAGTWLGLLLAGAGVGLFVGQCAFAPSLALFAADNGVARESRLGMLLFSGMGAVLALGISSAWALRKNGPTAVATCLAQALRLLAPLGLSALIPGLFSRSAWKDRELWLLAAVLGFALLFERFVRSALLGLSGTQQRWAPKDSRATLVRFAPPVLLAILVGYYCVYVSHLTIVNHHKLATSNADMAEFDSLFFNALHGHPFRSPVIEGDLEDWTALKVHAEFGLYFLLPFYALKPGPETLLQIQAALVGLSAVPFYQLARRRVGDWGALIVAFAFLQTRAVQRPNFYELHFTPLGMFFVAWLFVCLDWCAVACTMVVTTCLLHGGVARIRPR